MTNHLVLIVEDEGEIAEIMRAFLEREGFRVVVSGDGATALDMHRMLSPDLIVLDMKLPRKDGREVLNEVRRGSDTPVIMVTALGQDLDKLVALNMGADDYLVKPFNPLELVARAKAILRRTSAGQNRKTVLRVGALQIETIAHQVQRISLDGTATAIEVTPTEFRILSHMARAPRKAFTRMEILDACLPADGNALERTVDSHISKLRTKLEANGVHGMLDGVRGIGYRLSL